MPPVLFSLGSPVRIKTQSCNGCNFIEYLLSFTRGVYQRCPQYTSERYDGSQTHLPLLDEHRSLGRYTEVHGPKRAILLTGI